MRSLDPKEDLMDKNFDWLFTTPIAHRGLHGEGAVENGMTAFRRAVEAGLNIEIDVHLNKSGDIIIHHDSSLLRICGVDKKIKNVTTSELAGLKLSGTEDGVPLLSELLALTESTKTGLLIELKDYVAHTRLEKKLYEMLKDYKGRFAVQSFNPITVRWFKRHAPEVASGFLTLKAYAKHLKPDFIAYEINHVTEKNSRSARARSVRTIAWTVDTAERLAKARELVDNVIFEKINPNNLTRD